jgi:hypothetical protein
MPGVAWHFKTPACGSTVLALAASTIVARRGKSRDNSSPSNICQVSRRAHSISSHHFRLTCLIVHRYVRRFTFQRPIREQEANDRTCRTWPVPRRAYSWLFNRRPRSATVVLPWLLVLPWYDRRRFSRLARTTPVVVRPHRQHERSDTGMSCAQLRARFRPSRLIALTTASGSLQSDGAQTIGIQDAILAPPQFEAVDPFASTAYFALFGVWSVAVTRASKWSLALRARCARTCIAR